MYGGTISDNHEEYARSNYGGGGVCAHSSGTFTMYGGTISNNHSVTDAGGVAVVGGIMNIYGGTIRNNTADNNGGGIWTNINGFIISGNSVIENNTAVKGGGVYYGSSSNTMTISESARISVILQPVMAAVFISIREGTLHNERRQHHRKYRDMRRRRRVFGGDTFSISGNLDISGNKKRAQTTTSICQPTNISPLRVH